MSPKYIYILLNIIRLEFIYIIYIYIYIYIYNPAGTPVYRNGTEFLRLEGASVGCAGCINSQPTRPSDET